MKFLVEVAHPDTWWLSDLCFGKGSNVAVGSSGNTVDVAVRW